MTASSIATIDELAPGRVALGFGAGDTAVRLSGLRPARVAEMEDAIVLMRGLLAGEEIEVGAERPPSESPPCRGSADRRPQPRQAGPYATVPADRLRPTAKRSSMLRTRTADSTEWSFQETYS